MKNHVLPAAVCASFLAVTGLPGTAQQPSPMPQQDRIPAHEQNLNERSGMDGMGQGRMGRHDGMMGGMPEGRGMMHHGMMGGGMMGHHGMMNPVLMRMIFALMDSDGDGTVSLQEWQAAHEKIFRAMDVDKDGTITFEEMMNFMRGRRGSTPQR